MWCPSSRHILTSSDHALKSTIWSLVDPNEIYYIKLPKYNDRAIHFSPNHRYLAVAERYEGRDYISIYDTETWTQISIFHIEGTEDLYDFTWSPDSLSLAIYDHPLDYTLAIYTIDAKQQCRYRAYEHGLGISNISWSHNGLFLAVASYDGIVRIFHTRTWKIIREYQHIEKIQQKNIVR